MLGPMLRLRPFERVHFPMLSSWFRTEADLVQWGGPSLSFPLSNEQLCAMLEEGRRVPPARLSWMVERDDVVVGHAQLAFDWRNGNALLSRVAIAPAARGHGLATPMLKLVVDRAFGFDQVQRVELNVYTWNLPAIRTYERLGFAHEGVRRSSAQVEEQRWDTAFMGLLRKEWRRGSAIGREQDRTQAEEATRPAS